MNIWITTDTHFGHKKIIQFGRPEDFEDRIKKGLLNVVNREDILIHLGDVSMAQHSENSRWFKENLKCKTYLIRGNHDHKSISWYLGNGWDVVADRLDIKIFGAKFCFTHKPVAWDGHFDINYHGHFHDTDHRKNDPQFNGILTDRNKLIALENIDYKPIKLKQI